MANVLKRIASHLYEVEMGSLHEALDAVGADPFEKQVICSKVPRVTREQRSEEFPDRDVAPSVTYCDVYHPPKTRKELLDNAGTPAERKALQAAYKRLQRKPTMSALRKELRSRAERAAWERADRRESWEYDFDREDHGKHNKAHRVPDRD